MYANFSLFCVTVVVLAIVDKISVWAGVITFAILTYLCTVQYVLEGAAYFHVDNRSWFTEYIYRLSRFSKDILCSVNWPKTFKSVVNFFKFVGEYAKFFLRFRDTNVNTNDDTSKKVNHCGDLSSIEAELDTFVKCILREYIKSWYHTNISENEDCINDINNVIRGIFLKLSEGVGEIDVNDLCNEVLWIYLHFLEHLKDALVKAKLENNIFEACVSNKEEVLKNFEMHHWAMKDEITERCYLKSITTILLKSYAPEDIMYLKTFRTAVIEILTQSVICSLVRVLTDPFKLNTWILRLLHNFLNVKPEICESNITSETSKMKMSESDIKSEASQMKMSKSDVKSETSQMTESNVELAFGMGHGQSKTLKTYHKESLVHPEIVLTEENGNELVHENSSSDELSLASNSSKFDASVERISRESCRVSNDNSLFPCEFTSTPNKAAFLKNSTFSLSSSSYNENLDEKHLSGLPDNVIGQNVFKMYSPPETQIKRSKSAEYIRHLKDMNINIPLSSSSVKLNRKSNTSLAETSNNESNIDDSKEPTEFLPLFDDVKITGAKLQEDFGRHPYVLYCVEYKGLFQKTGSNSSSPSLVRESVLIKRRFREFFALNSRLESNPKVKIYLKGIKGPTRKFIGNLDEKVINERKTFLESYLQKLCKHPEISKSSELQEFLAYGSDASIAYVEKPIISRFDKVINRTVRSAFGFLRTALPADNPISPKLKQSPHHHHTHLELSSSELCFPDYVLDFSQRDSEVLSLIENLVSYYEDDEWPSKLLPILNEKEIKHKPKKSFLWEGFDIDELDSCHCPEFSDPRVFIAPTRHRYHQAYIVLHIITSSLYMPGNEPPSTLINLINCIPVPALNNFLKSKLSEINEAKCVSWLHSIHRSIWPEERNPPKSNSDSNLPFILCDFLKDAVKGSGKGFTASLFLENFVEQRNLVTAVELLLGSLQNEKLNKCLLFHFLDEIVEVLYKKQQTY